MYNAWNHFFDNPNSGIAHEARMLSTSPELVVSLTFLFPVNKSDSTAIQNAKLWGIIPHNDTPDWDNLSKFYMDAGNGILWTDDKIVTFGSGRKGFSTKPRTIIEIKMKQKFKLDSKAQRILEIFGPEELKKLVSDLKIISSITPAEIDEHCSEGHSQDSQGSQDSQDATEWHYSTALKLAKFAANQAPLLHKVNKFKANNFNTFPQPIC